ncbi:FG-GAP-like repeat-containing protein [Streptomyces sp. NPDC026665]|uniref:FG-GAP-like repeat-containing protein n=1 Tax=Streptomyces sp. NPDC026665 TaxID=3154798 RepID=UPI0033E5EBCE
MFSARSYARRAVPLTLGLAALGVAVPPASASPTTASVRDDFNGDGYADLVVGAPNATVGGRTRAGYAAVLYGGPHGLAGIRRTIVSRATAGVPGDPTAYETFGLQLAKGDLDGDGYSDLVVGTRAAGADAVVLWGGPRGLSGGTPVPGNNTQTGDFDGDGHLDLAVFRASYTGGDDPRGTTAEVWTGPVTRSGTPAAAAPLDPDHLQYIDVHDGTAGDINGDGRADLALTAHCGEGGDCGRVYLGGPSGLTRLTGYYLTGDGVLTLGDVNGDGYDDLIGGYGYDDAITVVPGSAGGPSQDQSSWKEYTQDTPGVPGVREAGDMFGASIAVGDVDGDGIDDVAVGAPGENGSTGVVDVLRGSRSGLTGAHARAFTQNTEGVPGVSEPGDGFGHTVRLLDVDRDGHADLAASAANEDAGNGAVWLLHGAATGVVTDGALVLGGRTLGAPYAKAAFGSVLR